MDFEQSIPQTSSGTEILGVLRDSDISRINPDVIPENKLRLKVPSEEELNIRMIWKDRWLLKELREKRPDLEVLVDSEPESKTLYIRRRGREGWQQDLIFVLDPGFNTGEGMGHIPCVASDIYIGGDDGQFVSAKSVFPDSNNLGIRLSFLGYVPENKPENNTGDETNRRLNLSAFGDYFAYDDIAHNLELFEPSGNISMAVIGHEAGHAWVSKLNLLGREKYGRVHLNSEVDWLQVDNYDPAIFTRIRDQRADERLSSIISRVILNKITQKNFRVNGEPNNPSDRDLLEYALTTYDRSFAFVMMRFAEKFNLDPRQLFGARVNRTQKGIDEIKKSILFAQEINDQLYPISRSLLDENKVDQVGNDWFEPYRRDYFFEDQNIHLKISTTSGGRFLDGTITDYSDPDNKKVLEWSPYFGVQYEDKHIKVEATPGGFSNNPEAQRESLREIVKSLKSRII